VHLLVGSFVATKFVSIFAFLFGLGAALQFRSIYRGVPAELSPADRTAEAQTVYRRRLKFLLAVGLAHGFFLYFGDILALYAVCGFILVHYLPRRPAQLVRSLVRWWLAAVIVTVLVTFIFESARRRVDTSGDPMLIPLETMTAFTTYTSGTYLEQLVARASDYTTLLGSMLLVSTPQIVGLFLLGLLAGRLGWLAQPERHPRVWQAATWIGLAALPFAAYGEWLNLETMKRNPGDPGTIGYLLQFFGSAVACFYVALVVRLRNAAPVASLIRWMAPAGRMPLTSYLAQSVVLGFLLSGWGLGLGAALNRGELAVLALAIVAGQLPLSRWWIARFGRGPMEAWWARSTYRAASGSNSTFNQTPR
jgi:uncharacterized protein